MNVAMENLRVPKTPAQAWRDLDLESKAIRAGQILRVVWELSKPVLFWTIFILAVGVWSIFSIFWKVLFGGK